jgi:hypothetical protein
LSKGFYRYMPNHPFVLSGDRTRLVHKIFALASRVKQSDLTKQLAVKLLDRVFCATVDNVVTESAWEIIANGCIMLAAKFEELDMNIPMNQDLQVANKYKISYY